MIPPSLNWRSACRWLDFLTGHHFTGIIPPLSVARINTSSRAFARNEAMVTTKRNMQIEAGRICAGLVAAALVLLLGGCDARFTADFGTDAPADTEISRVQVNLLGLDFRKADGASSTLEFRRGELVDLLELRDGDPLRLFTDEQLPVGRYTGVRLLFDDDEDDNAVTTGARKFPLRLADGDFAAVDFLVEDEEASQETLTLMLDLRQSLSFHEATDEYTLTPRLRAVRSGDAARIEGNVAAVCPDGTLSAPGAAIYLFSGTGVEPDDLDGATAEPFATTAVVRSGIAGLRYALRFLPAGDYTLALTCNGSKDVLNVDDDLAFRNVQEVQLDEGEVAQRDLD